MPSHKPRVIKTHKSAHSQLLKLIFYLNGICLIKNTFHNPPREEKNRTLGDTDDFRTRLCRQHVSAPLKPGGEVRGERLSHASLSRDERRSLLLVFIPQEQERDALGSQSIHQNQSQTHLFASRPRNDRPESEWSSGATRQVTDCMPSPRGLLEAEGYS